MATMPAIPSYLMTLREAAAYLNISYNSVRELVRDGHLRTARPKGRLIRIYRRSLEAYAERVGDPARPAPRDLMRQRPQATPDAAHPPMRLGRATSGEDSGNAAHDMHDTGSIRLLVGNMREEMGVIGTDGTPKAADRSGERHQRDSRGDRA